MSFWRILLRRLGRHPGFTAIAVLTLALGIGTNTAVFTVAHTLLLKPLPWPESDRVVNLWESNASKGAAQAPMAAAQLGSECQVICLRPATPNWVPGNPTGVAPKSYGVPGNLSTSSPGVWR